MNHSIYLYSESISGYDFSLCFPLSHHGNMQISARYVPTALILSNVIPFSLLKGESKRLFLLFPFSIVAYSFLAERISNQLYTHTDEYAFESEIHINITHITDWKYIIKINCITENRCTDKTAEVLDSPCSKVP